MGHEALPSSCFPLRIRLPYLLFFRACELLASESLFGVGVPIIVIAADAGYIALVTLRRGEAHVVEEEGGVGVVIVVFVSEDGGLFVLRPIFGLGVRMAVAHGLGEPVTGGLAGVITQVTDELGVTDESGAFSIWWNWGDGNHRVGKRRKAYKSGEEVLKTWHDGC